jgi:hypothetical protein
MRSTTRPRNQLLFAALFLYGLYLVLAVGLYLGLTKHSQGGNDFFSRWEGARALFLRDENPYSDSVTHEIQMGMTGRLALPGEDQLAFAYPLYVAFPISPLVTLPYALAQACWMALLILAVLGAATALIRLYQPNLHPPLLWLLPVGALLFYPSVRGIFNGQITLLSIFLISAALWAIGNKSDTAAGILLAFATIKPQPAVLIVPIVVIWAWRQRRLRLVTSALGTLSGLIGVATLLSPTWMLDFLYGLRQYAQYEPVGPPVQLFAELIFPIGWSAVFTVVPSLILVGWLFRETARSLDKPWVSFQSTIGLAAIVTTLMAGRMGTPDQLLLLIPWSQWFSARLHVGEYARGVLAGLILLILPWYVFLATLQGNAENPNVALVLPFFFLAVYIWESRRLVGLLPEQAQ